MKFTGPIYWGSHPGEMLERVMAVFMAQEHPDTLRRTPASGDGGIDLMVPVEKSYEVYQVKNFVGRINSSQRKQIETSYKTLLDNPRLDRPIVQYYVVVPIDQTPDEQSWFENLIRDAPWPAAWLGLTFWDKMAADNPHVLDYFFGGGRDRIARRSRALQASIQDPTDPLTTMDVVGRVDILRNALNNEDPHWLYDMRTDRTSPPSDELRDCAMTMTQQTSEGTYVTILVRPKHRYSFTDSPIKVDFTVTIPENSETVSLKQAFSDFVHFGHALELPEGSVTATFTAPGGLGGTFEQGSAWLAPVDVLQKRPPLRLIIFAPDKAQLGDLILDIDKVSTGIKGGVEVTLTDRAKVLSGYFRISANKTNRTFKFSYHVNPIEGRPVVELLPTLRAVAALKSPNIIELRPQYGTTVFARAHLQTIDEAPVLEPFITHLNDLGRLQDFATMPVLINEDVDPSFANSLRQLIAIVEGEAESGTWDELSVTFSTAHAADEIRDRAERGERFAVEQLLTVNYNELNIEIGTFTTVVESAIRHPQDVRGSESLRLAPGTDNTYLRRFGDIG